MDALANFATGTVATAPSPATSGASLTVGSGEGANFPAAPFNLEVTPAGARPTPGNSEVVRVTAKSTDTFTITRAQESSTARSIVVGDKVQAGVTAGLLTGLVVYPWTINVNPQVNGITIAGTWSRLYLACIGGGILYNSAGGQNSEVGWDLVLAAGTWDFSLIRRTGSSFGIASVLFDNSSVGTIDCYSSGATNDVFGQVTGITVATTAKVRVSLKSATKNASSSGYDQQFQLLGLRRTA